MAKLRVAINGFGRIGRCLTRQLYNHSTIELAAINTRSPLEDADVLEDDSVYGKFPATITLEKKIKVEKKQQSIEKYIHIDKMVIPFSEGDEPIACNWKNLKIDVVIDATGNFPKLEWIIDHCTAGAKNVVTTYPPSTKEIKTIMVGVNEQQYDPVKDHIVSAGSCTAMAIAPLLKHIDSEWGLEHCHVLATRASQRACSEGWNIIPRATEADLTIPAVLPLLEGKVVSMVNLVPVYSGSQAYFNVTLKKETTVEEVHAYFTKLKQKEPCLLDLCQKHVRSSYFRGDSHAAVIDARWTFVDKKNLRLVAWFDNEWGYCARLVALLEYIASKTKRRWF